jgi:hypothetical protein
MQASQIFTAETRSCGEMQGRCLPSFGSRHSRLSGQAEDRNLESAEEAEGTENRLRWILLRLRASAVCW